MFESEWTVLIRACNQCLHELTSDDVRFSAAGAIILRMAYSHEVKEGKDELVEIVEKSVHGFSVASTPGAFMVEFFPFRMTSSIQSRDVQLSSPRMRSAFRTCLVPRGRLEAQSSRMASSLRCNGKRPI